MSIFQRSGQVPSITEGDRALQLFTDRGALVRLFCERLHAEPPDDRILFLHGDGGNGKSLLLRYLQTHACKRFTPERWRQLAAICDDDDFRRRIEEAADAAPVPWAGLNFADKPEGVNLPQDPFYGPLMLRRQVERLRLLCPLYDYATLCYLQGTHQLTRDRIRSLFPAEVLDLIDALAQAVFNISLLAVGKAVLNLFDRHLGERFVLYRARRKLAEADVEAIRRLPANPDLYDLLPELLARDLSAAIKLPGAPQRLVLFFDTHEALWGRERDLSGEAFFARDAWLRRLLGNLELGEGIVVVVAGRDRPRWPDAPAWAIPARFLDMRLVGELSDGDAEQYLVRAGVDDPALRRHLVAFAGGHPYFLGLCADVVLAAAARGERLGPADFEATEDLARKERLLVDRLLRYVDLQVEHAVRALSAARAFDWEVYAMLGRELHFNATEPDFRVLTGFSFVTPASTPGRDGPATTRYRMHKLLRRLLDCDPVTLQADAALEAYYRGRGDDAAIAEATYHAFQQDRDRGAKAWCEAMESAVQAARWGLCGRLAEVRREMPMDDPFWLGRASAAEADYLAALSQHAAAQAAYGAAAAAYDEALRRAPDLVAAYNNKGSALCGLADLLAGLGQHAAAREAYGAAVAAYDEALRRAPDDVYAHNNKGNALRGLAGLLAGLGQHAAAREAYGAAAAAYDEALARAPDYVYAHNNRGNALLGLADLLAGLGQHDAAREAYGAAVAAYDEALRRAPDLVQAHGNKGTALCGLADLLAGLGQHAAAREAYGAAVAACDEALARAPDDVAAHNNKGEALRGLAGLLTGLSQHAAARAAYEAAVAACDEALARAPDDVATHNNKGNALRGLAGLLAGLSQHAAAREAYEAAVAAYDEALARAPDDVAAHNNKGNALRGLADLLAGLGQHAAARAAYGAAAAACDEALTYAPDYVYVHNNKGEALRGLAGLLARLGQHDAARAAYEAAAAAYDQALARAPDYIRAHNNKGNALLGLADLLADLSQHDAARAAYGAAVAACDEALRRAPDCVAAHNNKGNALLGLADLLADLSQHDAARAAYEAAIEAYGQAARILPYGPGKAEVCSVQGTTLRQLRRWEDAEAAHRCALELDPNRCTDWVAVADIARRRGDRDAWQEALARARPLLDETDLYDVACFESVAGNTERALALLAQAVTERPDRARWAQHDPDLEWNREDPRFRGIVGS